MKVGLTNQLIRQSIYPSVNQSIHRSKLLLPLILPRLESADYKYSDVVPRGHDLDAFERSCPRRGQADQTINKLVLPRLSLPSQKQVHHGITH